MILEEIEKTNVSILSKSAEEYFNFVNKSRAILLGITNENDCFLNIDRIILKIKSFRDK